MKTQDEVEVQEIRKKLKDEIDKRFHVKFYNVFGWDEFAEIELCVSGGKIPISIFDWDREGKCIIEYPIIWLKEYEGLFLTDIYKLFIILRSLYSIMGKHPQVDFFENKDTGGGQISVYYLADISKIESIIYILEAFNKIDLKALTIDKLFIKENYSELFDLYQRKKEETIEKIASITACKAGIESKCMKIGVYRPIVSEIFSQEDCVYRNYNQRIVVGFGQEGIERYSQKYQFEFTKISDYYNGVHYNIMMGLDGICVWDNKLWMEAFSWLELLEMNYDDLPVYIGYDKGIILVRVMEFWVCIITEADQLEEKVQKEKVALISMQETFLNYTQNDIFSMTYDLYQLSADEFESMCCELLYEEGYNNIQRRGKANAPDGGVDIEATEIVRGITTQEEKKWIFQCKRTRRIDRKALCEVDLLLRKFQADGYGLFYAGVLTPDVWDSYKSYEKYKVWIYDEGWIKQKLKEYDTVANKYFPLYKMSKI